VSGPGREPNWRGSESFLSGRGPKGPAARRGPTGEAASPLHWFEAIRRRSERKLPATTGSAMWAIRKGRRAERFLLENRESGCSAGRSWPECRNAVRSGRVELIKPGQTGARGETNLPGGESRPYRR
jgi:hypothetical protein